MTQTQQELLARLDAQIAYAEMAVHSPTLSPSHQAVVQWLNVLSRVRRERAVLIHSI